MFKNGVWVTLQDETNGSAGTGTGSGAGDDGKPAAEDSAALMAKAVSILGAQVQSLQESQAAIAEKLQTLGTPPKAEEEIPTVGDIFKDVNLEEADPKALVAMMVEKLPAIIDAQVEKRVKTVEERVGAVSTTFQEHAATTAIKEFQKDHSDLVEWSREMRDEIRNNPSLNIQDAYTLARAHHPDKAKEIDKKYTKQESKDDKIISLFSTSGPSSKSGKMSPQEAALSAFDSVMAQLGGSGDVRSILK